MYAEVGDLHEIKDRRSCNILDPWLGNYLGILSSCIHHVPMQCEHRIVISVSQVEITNIKSWHQPQLWSDYAYPLWEVRSDDPVLKVMRDVFTTNCASQRWDVVRKDRRDLIRIHQIIAVLSSFLGRGLARPTCSRGGCLQFTH
jgi:hypothetical protein